MMILAEYIGTCVPTSIEMLASANQSCQPLVAGASRHVIRMYHTDVREIRSNLQNRRTGQLGSALIKRWLSTVLCNVSEFRSLRVSY